MTVPKPKVEHTYQEIPNGGLGDMFFSMDEIRSFTHEDFNSQEINNVLVTADYDVNKVREKYELSKKQRNQIVEWQDRQKSFYKEYLKISKVTKVFNPIGNIECPS